MKQILDYIEKEIDEHASESVIVFQLGLALKVFEDRLSVLGDVDNAQRCNILQQKLIKR